MKKYQVVNTGTNATEDLDVVERKLKNKQVDRYERNHKANEANDYKRG